MSDDIYEQTHTRYALIRDRTVPYWGDPCADDYDPVYSRIVMAVRSCARELIEELNDSWRALNDPDRELGEAYAAELHGRCYVIFRGIQALADKIEGLPTREEAAAIAQRQAACVEARARELLAEKFGHGRTQGGQWVHFIADDGFSATRSASADDIVDALIDAGLLADRLAPQ